MEIRQKINERRQLVTILASAVVFLAILFSVWQLFGGRSPGNSRATRFYSDDDGDTYFIADATRIAPFDHNGRTAVVAQVFRCSTSGKPFVGYLMKYSDEVKTKIENAGGQKTNGAAGSALLQMSNAMLAKRPHDATWIESSIQTATKYQAIFTPACPDGKSQTLISVTTLDPDNGAQSRE